MVECVTAQLGKRENHRTYTGYCNNYCNNCQQWPHLLPLACDVLHIHPGKVSNVERPLVLAPPPVVLRHAVDDDHGVSDLDVQLAVFAELADDFDHGRRRLHQEVLEAVEGGPVGGDLGPALQQDVVDVVGAGLGLVKPLIFAVDFAKDLRPFKKTRIRLPSSGCFFVHCLKV